MYACDVHFGANLGADDGETCDSPSCPFHELRAARMEIKRLDAKATALAKRVGHWSNCRINIAAEGPCDCGLAKILGYQTL